MSLFRDLKSALGANKVDLKQRFEILHETTSGTMSKFYKARDLTTKKIVGLKVLDPQKTRDFEARLKGLKKPSEAEVLRAIKNPRVVSLLEDGVSTRGEIFLVMEFIEGQGLNALIRAKSPLLEGRRLRLLRQAAQALTAVHDSRYIHRDVCPGNFMVSPDGAELKLIDFGLTIPATPEFTRAGNRTGKPNYMAPELIMRQPTDVRVDVFAFGVSAYELCCGRLPWERGDTGQVAMTHVTQPPIELQRYRPQVAPRLAEAISKCIERDRDQRCASLRIFSTMIEGIESEDQS